MYESSVNEMEDITFSNNFSIFNLTGNTLEIPVSEIDSITFSNNAGTNNEQTVYIIYNENKVTVINPLEAEGVNITTAEGGVSVTATNAPENVEYHISGNTSDGYLLINSERSIRLTISNLQLTNPNGAAIYITQNIAGTVQLNGNSTLSDGSGSSQNAAFLTKGNIIFEGAGKLTISGYAKHAVSAEGIIQVNNGTIEIVRSSNDGLHSKGFVMNDGNLIIGNTAGDGIDAGSGSIEINDGTIKISSASDDVKGIKSDNTLTINGGTIDMTVSGGQSKGLHSKDRIVINDGNITITTSGVAVLQSSGNGYDPSYCGAIKSKGDIIITNGTIRIESKSTSDGGKGISADGNIVISNATIAVTTAGNGATYTNTSGSVDSYTACCIKSDRNISLLSGNITCSSSGTGGKGISADGIFTIGEANASDNLLHLTVSTSGERFSVSSGGGGMGGGNNRSNYANPKAIKCQGNMTVDSGTISITCTQSNKGGEGLESKSTLTLNGGIIDIYAYDDCINASDHIEINGGNHYFNSYGNDGIDSNGTLTINGGFIIANGTSTPEGGIDCDNSTFKITGGVIIGTGGSNNTPTAGVCTQRSIRYSGTADTAICLKNSSGEVVLLYQLPTYSGSGGNTNRPGGGGSSSMQLIFSDPALATGSYTLQYGGTISGGTSVNGYNTGGSYSGGSSRSFTVSSMVTSVN